jgi:tellurite resistance protein TerC
MLALWLAFICFILLLLALDLGVLNRKPHAVEVGEALLWSALWIALGLGFGAFVYFGYEHHWFGLGGAGDAVDGAPFGGRDALLKYLTGYLVEKSLSVDNLFVIAMLFSFFAVPREHQHRVLFWGILGALVMRGAMIGVGATLLARYHWLLYVFGAFLLFTAAKMLLLSERRADPSKNLVVRAARRLLPVSDRYDGGRFVTRCPSGRRALTPLSMALIAVEFTDGLFAVDSIPAIFAVTADPFLVFTSNVFAMLGLRSLYFALAGMIARFRYLKASLAIVLAIVGAKMLAAPILRAVLGHEFSLYLLALVLVILAAGIVASILAERRIARA